MHYSYYYNEDEGEEDDWSSLSELDQEQIFGTPGSAILSNVDYALNSPLILDDVEGLTNKIKGKQYRKSSRETKWNIVIKNIVSEGTRGESIKEPNKFHNWMGKFFQGRVTETGLIQKLLTQTQQDSEITGEVVQAFFTSWLKKNIELPNKAKVSNETLKYGSIFLDLHIITLMANAGSKKEKKNVADTYSMKSISSNSPDSFIWSSNTLGRVLISEGYIYLFKHKHILDRNMFLMFKDTAIARFQTLLSLENRIDKKFDKATYENMVSLYTEGDNLLIKYGIKAYKVFKMIEPITSQGMSEIAGETKPLNPKFDNFKDHIEESLLELSREGIYHSKFTNIIFKEKNVENLLCMFGSFRHWGHPFIDYLSGLKKMEEQVNMIKKIDKVYANRLASDLAYMVLKKEYKRKSRWFVDKKLISQEHPFYNHIKEHTWPGPKEIMDFGDRWHLLPLTMCYEIPDMIDPSQIYADKSHSGQLSEVLSHVRSGSCEPIPSKKVLNTFIKSPSTNWKKFLKEINDKGLSKEDLLIGLKAKEREIKPEGRFFTLMSWKLREYIVVTEYLIKLHFVPLFKGLTMADDMTTVIKKMMDNSSGQGSDEYEHVCIANHFDYTKWNNHQRGDANNPVFRVMGQFLGYPNLIERTHEFFEKSLIYYTGRPDLMRVENGTLTNKGHNVVCWNGQLGGHEGLRQKGWSIVNLLAIRRASKSTKAEIKILAQGDNQVICTNFKIQPYRSQSELNKHIKRIKNINNKLMDNIEICAKRLGLIINKDETLRSADYLVYGKVPVIRGNFKCLETKRWSRVTCVTNDQIPTLANILSTVGSNALTISHFSDSPQNTIVHYNFLGNFCRLLLEGHNPALMSKVPFDSILGPGKTKNAGYKASVLYLDPSLGGTCGTSLTRFMIRGFPDPVTEGLTFWKMVHKTGKLWVKRLAYKCGNPNVKAADDKAFLRLLENPLSLNIPGNINPTTLIKDEIKKELIEKIESIKNEIVQLAILHSFKEESRFITYLRSIKPLFPRFLSEYKAATFLGITESIIGLFQNSKTIRTAFTKKMDFKVKEVIRDSELRSIKYMLDLGECKLQSPPIWECSASQSDNLRFMSWGDTVHGATIPHPVEMINNVISRPANCDACRSNLPFSAYVSILIPNGLDNYTNHRGTHQAYLGSRTSESTSILQPWEKESNVPTIQRAIKLRNSIHWFVEGGSNLSKSIMSNLLALTGESWDVGTSGFKRTGSALHRFSCSRQEAGGYTAQNPAKLTWMSCTTDTLRDLGSQNYDFMYQSLLIYAQLTAGELHDFNENQGYYHFHIDCNTCLRTIEDITLNSEEIYQHPDVSEVLSKMKPSGTPWAIKQKIVEIKPGNWEGLSPLEQSYHIGRSEGFLFGEMYLCGDSHSSDSSLFPLSIRNKVFPKSYIEGILDGLLRAGCLYNLSKRSVNAIIKPKAAIIGMALHLIDKLAENPSLINIWRYTSFERLFRTVPHKVPTSYPLNNRDLGALGRNYMRYQFLSGDMKDRLQKSSQDRVWVFSDMNHYQFAAPYAISSHLIVPMFNENLCNSSRKALRKYKDLLHTVRDTDMDPIPLTRLNTSIVSVQHELRHASKSIINTSDIYSDEVSLKWEKESVGDVTIIPIDYCDVGLVEQTDFSMISVKKIQDPLISGLRLFQLATGAHYKLRSILSSLKLHVKDAIVGGDGSGGLSALILRMYPNSRILFNSLLDLRGVNLRGSSPSPPSAILELGKCSNRCLNLETVWENPTDLSKGETWRYFIKESKHYNLEVNLVILDMECREDDMSDKIEIQISTYIFLIGRKDLTLIYKTYLNRLIKTKNRLLDSVGVQFLSVYATVTEYTSSHSSELYIIMQYKNQDQFMLKPCLSKIKESLYLIPVMKHPLDEFDRAIKLSKKDQLQGVPRSLRPIGRLEVIVLLCSLGIETGVAGLIGSVCEKLDMKGKITVSVGILLVIFRQILKFHFGYKNPQPPPTDSQVVNLGAALIGYLFWSSVSLECFELKRRGQDYIDNYFTLGWESKTIRVKGSDLIFYNFSINHKFTYEKNIHMDSAMAKIGQFIRVYGILFGYPSERPDKQDLNKFLKGMGYKTQLQDFMKRTDLIDMISGRLITDLTRESRGPEFPMEIDEESYVD